MFTNILGYKIFKGTKEELFTHIESFSKVNIISGNPEVLYNGINNPFIHDIYIDSNSLIIPDGVGTVIASKIVKSPVKEKIAGIEVMQGIIKKCEMEQKGIYLLGAEESVVNQCTINLLDKYPNLKILGSHDGFFDLDNCEEIIEQIQKLSPYALFIAMGCPKQETFIAKYIDVLPCRIFMGVGGSFDVIAGKVNRAPRWMISLGLEWLYRVSKEPLRIKRLKVIPKFLLKVIFEGYSIKKKH